VNIVFDFGGVVFRWQPVAMLMRELPHIATNETSAGLWVGRIFQNYGGDWGDFDRGTVEPAALVQRIARRTGLSAADVQRVVDAVPQELQPLPDSVAWVRRLQAAGHTLFYLSNMPVPYAQHLEDSHDFFSCFTAGVFSARVRMVKPERAIFDFAAAQFGKTAGELVFFDDHLPNVQAAQAAGWQALHFSDAARAEADLLALKTRALPPP
jgi:putative hydrolase of the HAD superfamily